MGHGDHMPAALLGTGDRRKGLPDGLLRVLPDGRGHSLQPVCNQRRVRNGIDPKIKAIG